MLALVPLPGDTVAMKPGRTLQASSDWTFLLIGSAVLRRRTEAARADLSAYIGELGHHGRILHRHKGLHMKPLLRAIFPLSAESVRDRTSKAAACLAILVCLAAGPLVAAQETFGVWENPQGSVHIRLESCGDARCGVVVWANAKAKADALEGGTANLIGTTILMDFRETDDGTWEGKAFVPDIGKEFSGFATVENDSTLTVKGCLIGHLGCKSQTWTRIGS